MRQGVEMAWHAGLGSGERTLFMLKVSSTPNQKPGLGVEVPQGGNALMKSTRSAILVGVAVSAMLLISSTQLLRAQVQGAWTLTGDVTAARELGAQATL